MAALTDLQVDVGGRMVHVVRAGQGSPAVVLEAGAGCGADLWRAVQEQVGEVTAAFSYDRAGHGASDPNGPWSLENWLADLEAWLAAAAVPSPYVLVGHSVGAHVVRAFAARRPRDVVGLVLIDARPERLEGELPKFSDALAALVPEDSAQARRADKVIDALPGLGDLPLTVITHGRADWVPEILDFSPAELDHCDRVWQRSQRGLATLSANSTFRTAERSGHLIPAERPDLVAAEIVAMVAQVNGQL
jgi:pimeloyl-ACP methyl ester carboxylesterase